MKLVIRFISIQFFCWWEIRFKRTNFSHVKKNKHILNQNHCIERSFERSYVRSEIGFSPVLQDVPPTLPSSLLISQNKR